MIKKLIFPCFVLFCVGSALRFAGPPAAADPLDVTPLPPVTDADGRLGVCYGFYENPEGSGQRPYLDLMIDAGARHDRWDFSWWAIQPDNQSQWNWGGHEAIVRDENAQGVSVLGILQWTPQWASTYSGLLSWLPRVIERATADARYYAHTFNPLSPTGPAPYNNYPPKNLDQPVFLNGQINPDNYWGYFVYNVAQHFDAQTDPALQIDEWEIWNEVEGDWFWAGTANDYCQLLQVAYTAIKGDGSTPGGNPNASVLFAGLHYWADPTMYTQVLDCLAAADPGGAGHNYFFDVMSVHFYSRSDNTYDMVNLIRGEMDARGMADHPIWLTETGAPIYGDNWPGVPYLNEGDNFLTIDEQAAYVIQSYANALAAGVERYYFFRAHDADMGEPHGLIRNDLSLRPAYVAYQVAAQYLRGENQATRVVDNGVTRVSLWGTPRGKVSVLWNRTPAPLTYTLSAAMPTAMLVDRWGMTQTLSATNGAYTLPLSVATANLLSNPGDYIVGGDPLLLIETDTLSPTSALEALPTVNKGLPITLTWAAADAESGVWYTEIQSGPSPAGPWSTLAGWGQTEGLTQTVYTGQHGVTFYFRARARDKVGNWETWPAGHEVSTTVDADTELHWTVDTLFTDINRDGVWQPFTGTLTFEVALADVAMRFVDADRNIITATVGSSWRFTETLLPGTYSFVAEATDASGNGWIRYYPLALDGVVDPLYAPLTATLGLLPRQDVFLPLALRHP
jgi:hypothetical protein